MRSVLTLERTVLDGSVNDVADVLKGLGPFEFTARALALSMRFGDAAKTELLLKSGAMLDYDVNSNILRLEYSTVYSTSEIWGSDYPAKYSLFPVFDRVTERHLFFGTLYDPSGGADAVHSPSLFESDGSERAPAPESVRAESVDAVCRRNALDAAHCEELLYYAVLFGCHNISDVLRSRGVRLSESRDVSGGYIRLISSFGDINVAVRDELKREVAKNSANFEVNDGMVTYLLRYESWLTTRWAEFVTLLMCGAPTEHSLLGAAKRLVEMDADGKLAELAELGLLPNAALPELTEFAIDNDRNRALAFLLNLKHGA